MAIWQYSFKLIPKRSIAESFRTPKYDKNGWFRDHVYWEKVPTSISFFKEIEKILPQSDSWSKNLLIFGNLESNCFQVSDEETYVKSVSFRIDFTSDFGKILRKIISFASSKDLILLDDKNGIIASNYRSTKRLIEQSEQYQKFTSLVCPKS